MASSDASHKTRPPLLDRWVGAGPAAAIPVALTLLVVAIGAGFGIKWFLSPTMKTIDGTMVEARSPDGRRPPHRNHVTSLAWSQSGALLGGTSDGTVFTYGPDGAISLSNRSDGGMIKSVKPGGAAGQYAIRVRAAYEALPGMKREDLPEGVPKDVQADGRVRGAEIGQTYLDRAEIGLPNSPIMPMPIVEDFVTMGPRDRSGGNSLLLGVWASDFGLYSYLPFKRLPPVTFTLFYVADNLTSNGAVSEQGPPPGVDPRAIATMPDASMAVVGTGDGGVLTVHLTHSDFSDNQEFYLPQDSHHAPVVAVAAGGTAERPVLASASADGEVLIHHKSAMQPPGILPHVRFESVPAGLPERHWGMIGESRGNWTDLLALSTDGDALVLKEGESSFLIPAQRLGDPAARTPLSQAATREDPIFLFWAIDMSVLQVRSIASKSFVISDISVKPDRDGADTRVVSLVDTRGQVEFYRDRQRIELDPPPAAPAAAAFAPGNAVLAVVDKAFSLSLYSTSNGRLLSSGSASTQNIPAPPADMAFSSDGRRLIVLDASGSYSIFSVRTLKPIFVEERETGRPLAALSLDGSRLARATSNQALEVVDLTSGHTITHIILDADIAQILISADGRTIAIRDASGVVRVYREGAEDMAGQRPRAPWQHVVRADPPARHGLKLSADGSRLLLRTREGRVFVAATGDRRERAPTGRQGAWSDPLQGLLGGPAQAGNLPPPPTPRFPSLIRPEQRPPWTTDDPVEQGPSATVQPPGPAAPQPSPVQTSPAADKAPPPGDPNTGRLVEEPPASGAPQPSARSGSEPSAPPPEDVRARPADGPAAAPAAGNAATDQTTAQAPSPAVPRPSAPLREDGPYIALTPLTMDAPAIAADVAPDGSFAVLADAANRLLLYDLATPDARPLRLPDHGGLVMRLAIAPDGRKLAAASLDGRLSIIDIALARLAAALPLAHIMSHPQAPLMRPRVLDAPLGSTPDAAMPGEGDLVVIGSHMLLDAAQEEAARATAAGFPSDIFARDGVFRTATTIPSSTADALRRVRASSPGWEGAYVRVKEKWCPKAVETLGLLTCGVQGISPPAAAP